jgi:hypothetical protein
MFVPFSAIDVRRRKQILMIPPHGKITTQQVLKLLKQSQVDERKRVRSTIVLLI